MAENPYSITPGLASDLSRAQTIALGVGVVFTALTAVQVVMDPTQFYRSWVIGFLLIFGLGLGSLACLMLQYMSGGAWGMIVRRQLEAGARTMPLVTLLFIPIAIGMPLLYQWVHPGTDKVIIEKSAYLNPTWWIIRAVIVFAIWNTQSFVLNRLSAEEEKTGSLKTSKMLMGWSGIGILIYVLTLTFAVTDWVMSMNVHWFSTIFGLIFLGGQGLLVISLVLITTTLLMREAPMSNVVTKKHLHDLGKLLFMFTLFWTYVSFSQLLIIWSGNLPEEISWYIDRMGGSWIYVSAIMLFLQWMLPFLILLSQNIKRNPKTIRFMAIWVVVIRCVAQIWHVEPNYHSKDIFISWSDVTALLGLGGLWVAFYLWQLKRRPLIPVNAPDLQRSLAHGRAH